MDELLASHDDLRAALRLAVRELRKLNPGKADLPTLTKLRDVLTQARGVAERFRAET